MTLPRDEVRIARAERMYRAGMSCWEISKRMKVSHTAVRSWIDPEYKARRNEQARKAAKGKRTAYISRLKFGEPSKDAPSKAPDKTPEIVDLHRRGYNAQAIAAITRVPYKQVERALS